MTRNHFLSESYKKIVANYLWRRSIQESFRQTLTPRKVVQKTLPFSEELRYYDDLYQLLLFHFQEKQASHFFDLIEEHLETVNKEFNTVFKTFLRYKDYIINALELPYSNAKLEATHKLIKDIKRQAFGFRKFKNFKTAHCQVKCNKFMDRLGFHYLDCLG